MWPEGTFRNHRHEGMNFDHDLDLLFDGLFGRYMAELLQLPSPVLGVGRPRAV